MLHVIVEQAFLLGLELLVALLELQLDLLEPQLLLRQALLLLHQALLLLLRLCVAKACQVRHGANDEHHAAHGHEGHAERAYARRHVRGEEDPGRAES